MATRMSYFSGPSGYVLEPLREGADFTLYRGRQHGNPSTVLAIAPFAEQPSPQSLRRLEHEYSLAAELDPAWAANPLRANFKTTPERIEKVARLTVPRTETVLRALLDASQPPHQLPSFMIDAAFGLGGAAKVRNFVATYLTQQLRIVQQV